MLNITFNSIIQGASSDILFMGAIDLDKYLETADIDAEIIMLVHDSIVSIVREDHVDEYTKQAIAHVQIDRGLMIPGTPMGLSLDSEEGGSIDYSCGKFAEVYPELV